MIIDSRTHKRSLVGGYSPSFLRQKPEMRPFQDSKVNVKWKVMKVFYSSRYVHDMARLAFASFCICHLIIVRDVSTACSWSSSGDGVGVPCRSIVFLLFFFYSSIMLVWYESHPNPAQKIDAITCWGPASRGRNAENKNEKVTVRGNEWSLRAFASMPSTAIFFCEHEQKQKICFVSLRETQKCGEHEQASTRLNFASS